MNATFRRISKVAAALVAFSLVAAACGDDDDDDTSSGTTAPSTETTAGTTDTTTAAGTTAAPTTAAAKPKAGGKIVIGLEAENNSGWNMADSQCPVACRYVAQAVFDGLVIVNSDGKAEPFLAESVTPNADFTVWTIKARSGIKFHNGEAFNAAAIKANLDAGRAGAILALALLPIKDTVVKDDLTLEVQMNTPWSPFIEVIAGQGGLMMAPAQILAKDVQKPIGTGPFIFKEWVPNDHFTATKNPNYWYKGPKGDETLPYLDEVTFKPIPDVQARENALKAGDIDMMQTGNMDTIAKLRDDKSLTIYYQDKPSEVGHLLLNQLIPELADKRVRQALAMCLNLEVVNENRNAGIGVVANGPFSPGSDGYLEDNGYPKYNPTEGKKLIAAYEAEKGKMRKFKLGTTNDPYNLGTNQLIQQLWKQDCGIETEILQIEQTQYITEAGMATANFEMFAWSNHGFADVDGNYFFWHSSLAPEAGKFAINFGRMIDKRIDDLLALERSSGDPAVRKKAAQDLNRIMGGDAMNVWIAWGIWGNIAKTYVKGVQDFKVPSGKAHMPVFYPGHVVISNIWLDK